MDSQEEVAWHGGRCSQPAIGLYHQLLPFSRLSTAGQPAAARLSSSGMRSDFFPQALWCSLGRQCICADLPLLASVYICMSLAGVMPCDVSTFFALKSSAVRPCVACVAAMVRQGTLPSSISNGKHQFTSQPACP